MAKPKQPQSLIIATERITIPCPYQFRNTALESCYINSQDIDHPVCYGCDHVATLKHDYGLRTYRRVFRVARCKHCDEVLKLHDYRPPFKGTRVPWCPGFEATTSEPDVVYIPINVEGTEWMVLELATGLRMPLAEYLGKRAAPRDDAFNRATRMTHADLRRFRLPLAGTPDTQPQDRLTAQREEALKNAEAERKRLYNKLHPRKKEKK